MDFNEKIDDEDRRDSLATEKMIDTQGMVNRHRRRRRRKKNGRGKSAANLYFEEGDDETLKQFRRCSVYPTEQFATREYELWKDSPVFTLPLSFFPPFVLRAFVKCQTARFLRITR